MAELNIEALRASFTHIEFLKIDRDTNAHRWYRLSWEKTTVGWAVVRMHGRMGSPKRTLQPLPFNSLDEAWPTIRALIRKRLRNGYVMQSYSKTPQAGVKSLYGPPTMTREEVDAFAQLALVEAA